MKKVSEWEKEFDKWFNHGTKDKPHGLLASDYYKEVKSFIQEALDRQRREIIYQVELKLATHIPTEPKKEDIQKFYNSIQSLRKDSK